VKVYEKKCGNWVQYLPNNPPVFVHQTTGWKIPIDDSWVIDSEKAGKGSLYYTGFRVTLKDKDPTMTMMMDSATTAQIIHKDIQKNFLPGIDVKVEANYEVLIVQKTTIIAYAKYRGVFKTGDMKITVDNAFIEKGVPPNPDYGQFKALVQKWFPSQKQVTF
jgi:hypothetical protein